MRAEYIGQNDSLGLKNGTVYNVDIDFDTNTVTVEGFHTRFAYFSIEQMEQNWKLVY